MSREKAFLDILIGEYDEEIEQLEGKLERIAAMSTRVPDTLNAKLKYAYFMREEAKYTRGRFNKKKENK